MTPGRLSRFGEYGRVSVHVGFNHGELRRRHLRLERDARP